MSFTPQTKAVGLGDEWIEGIPQPVHLFDHNGDQAIDDISGLVESLIQMW